MHVVILAGVISRGTEARVLTDPVAADFNNDHLRRHAEGLRRELGPEFSAEAGWVLKLDWAWLKGWLGNSYALTRNGARGTYDDFGYAHEQLHFVTARRLVRMLSERWPTDKFDMVKEERPPPSPADCWEALGIHLEDPNCLPEIPAAIRAQMRDSISKAEAQARVEREGT